MGKAYQALGKSKEAIEAWHKALDLQPNLAGAHLDLGNVYFEMGDFQKAQEEWKIALAGRPIDIPTHLANMGMVYFQTERYNNAIMAWQKASELKPGDSNLHYNLAVVYFKEGKYKAADMELNECLRIQPGYQNAIMLQEKINLLEGDKKD
jgi:superkiller protein 3